MAYIEQFIPTDIKALSGVLGERDQVWDANIAKEDAVAQKLAEMSATNTFDQQQKDRFREELRKSITDLDKKHNFDRSSSQYSSELTSTLNTLKADPYFSYKAKADEIAKARDTSKLQMKGDYFETGDPFAVTEGNLTLEERMNSLNTWGTLDRKENRVAGGLAGQALSKELTDYDLMNNPKIPGWFIVKQQNGQATLEDAKNLVKGNNYALAKEYMVGTHFEKYINNPSILEEFSNSMAEQAVGEAKINPLADPWNRPSAVRKPPTVKPNPNQYVDLGKEAPPQDDYIIRKADDFKKTNDYITTQEAVLKTLKDELDNGKIKPDMVDLKEAEAKKLEDDLFDLQVRRTQAKTVMNDIQDNTPEGVSSRREGTRIIQQGVPTISSAAADRAFEEMRDAFLYSNKAQRQFISQGLVRLVNSDPVGIFMMNPPNPAGRERSVSEYFADARAEMKRRDNGNLFGVDPEKHEGFLMYKVGEDLLRESMKGTDWTKYKTREEQAAKIDELWKPIKNTIKEFQGFYEGSGRYGWSGTGQGARQSFAEVESMMNKALEEGVMEEYTRVVPERSVKKTERDMTAQWFGANLGLFDTKEVSWAKGAEGEKRKGGVDEVTAKLKAAAAKGNVSITFLANPDAPLMARMEHPDGTKMLFQINPERLGPESSFMLAADIENEKVRNSLFAGLISPMKMEFGVDYNLSDNTPATRRMEKAIGKDLMDNIRTQYPDLMVKYTNDIDIAKGETAPSKKYVVTLEDGSKLRFSGRPALAAYLMEISGGNEKLAAIQARNEAMRTSATNDTEVDNTEEESF